MFDIGFSELLVIAVVALLVIGPERLPKVARTAGHMFGRLQRYVNEVKADIQREMELDELRKLRSQFEDAARSVEESVKDVDKEMRAAGDELNQAVASAAADPPAAAGAAANPSAAAAGALPPPGEAPADGPKTEAKV